MLYQILTVKENIGKNEPTYCISLVLTGYFVSAVEDLYETPSDLWLPGVAGPKFDIISR